MHSMHAKRLMHPLRSYLRTLRALPLEPAQAMHVDLYLNAGAETSAACLRKPLKGRRGSGRNIRFTETV